MLLLCEGTVGGGGGDGGEEILSAGSEIDSSKKVEYYSLVACIAFRVEEVAATAIGKDRLFLYILNQNM